MSIRLSEQEYKRIISRFKEWTPDAEVAPDGLPKRTKYGNRKVEFMGMKFDSKHELEVWLMLEDRRKRGEIMLVMRQVPFDLPGGIKYIADFMTVTHDLHIEGVYDAKSEATKKNRVYINKKKQMKACNGIDIIEL